MRLPGRPHILTNRGEAMAFLQDHDPRPEGWMLGSDDAGSERSYTGPLSTREEFKVTKKVRGQGEAARTLKRGTIGVLSMGWLDGQPIARVMMGEENVYFVPEGKGSHEIAAEGVCRYLQANTEGSAKLQERLEQLAEEQWNAAGGAMAYEESY